jgi:hypothetical protein
MGSPQTIEKPYYFDMKSYLTMATNPLSDRLNYLKAKLQAAQSVGMSPVSGATVGSGSTPVPIVRRLSILATPYALGKGGTSITGDSIPFYGGDSSFNIGSSNGILGAIVSRIGPLGLRQFPIYQVKPAATPSPASSSTSGNVSFYGSVQPQTASQKLNKLLS